MSVEAAVAPLGTPRQATDAAQGAHEAFECMPTPSTGGHSHPFTGAPRAKGWHRRLAHAWPGAGTRAGRKATAVMRHGGIYVLHPRARSGRNTFTANQENA